MLDPEPPGRKRLNLDLLHKVEISLVFGPDANLKVLPIGDRLQIDTGLKFIRSKDKVILSLKVLCCSKSYMAQARPGTLISAPESLLDYVGTL